MTDDVCMCGEYLKNHGVAAGHSPVSMSDYYRQEGKRMICSRCKMDGTSSRVCDRCESLATAESTLATTRLLLEDALDNCAKATRDLNSQKCKHDGSCQPCECERDRYNSMLEGLRGLSWMFEQGALIRDTSRDGEYDYHERSMRFGSWLARVFAPLHDDNMAKHDGDH